MPRTIRTGQKAREKNCATFPLGKTRWIKQNVDLLLCYFIFCMYTVYMVIGISIEQHSTYIVRYHCGGWSEEVNSCILIISYMVYL
jgi:hypothetical protein